MGCKKNAFIILVQFSIFCSSARAVLSAEKMKDFLVSCGYGTLAGAGLGLVNMTLSENPKDHTMDIARGASLGLYFGIGYGIYKQQNSRNDEYAFSIVPTVDHDIEGRKSLAGVALFEKQF